MSEVKATLTIERNGEEFDVDIKGDYHPFQKGYHEKGGGQIDPDEPAMVDDIEATYEGKPIELTEKEYEAAEEKLLEYAEEEAEPDCGYERDYDDLDRRDLNLEFGGME